MDVRVGLWRKLSTEELTLFELWCWRRLLRVPWTARRPNQSILKEISPGYTFLTLPICYFVCIHHLWNCPQDLNVFFARWIFVLGCYAKSLQSFLTLCNPIDSSPPGSPVPGILQARTLEWAAISFSNAWKWKVKVKLLSRVRLLYCYSERCCRF